jgi:hypothetical protein
MRKNSAAVQLLRRAWAGPGKVCGAQFYQAGNSNNPWAW